MVEAGILDGDYALIQKADTAREGDIVVALVDGQDATLKSFRREGPMIRLDPANSAYEPQRYAAGRVIVQGRLSGLLRRYPFLAAAVATAARRPDGALPRHAAAPPESAPARPLAQACGGRSLTAP